MPREMTDEERRRFEEDELHHRDNPNSATGPASEAEIVRNEERPKRDDEPTFIPPNPD